jgi:hypothetical protein
MTGKATVPTLQNSTQQATPYNAPNTSRFFSDDLSLTGRSTFVSRRAGLSLLTGSRSMATHAGQKEFRARDRGRSVRGEH